MYWGEYAVGEARWVEILAEQGFDLTHLRPVYSHRGEPVLVLVCRECGSLVPLKVPYGWKKRPIELHIKSHEPVMTPWSLIN